MKNQSVTLKNHKYPPGTTKNQRGTLKNPKNPPGTMKNQPGTLENHRQWPRTMNDHKTHLGPWKTNLNPWKPIWNHEKPIQTVKNHENQPGVVQGGYGWLQVVTGDSREEVIIFRDKQTDRHFIIIYISPSTSILYPPPCSQLNILSSSSTSSS